MKTACLILFLSSGIFSQNLHQRFEGIPFTINGNNSLNPFNGGIENPPYQFTDIDGDGDFDLFIYDKDTSLNFYRNEGNPSNPVFRLITLRYQNLSIRNWFFFCDINNDNDKDLFCGGDSQHVRYYENIGNPQTANFTIRTYVLLSNLNEIITSESASVPTFAD